MKNRERSEPREHQNLATVAVVPKKRTAEKSEGSCSKLEFASLTRLTPLNYARLHEQRQIAKQRKNEREGTPLITYSESSTLSQHHFFSFTQTPLLSS